MKRRTSLPSGEYSALRQTVPPLLLVAFIVLRYHSITSQFWMIDDTQILKFAITHQPLEYLFQPEIWKQLSAGNFTPLLPLSFLMDWKLFGLSPTGFYLHQLTMCCLLAVAVYVFLRLWLPELFCFLGCLLFVASPPFSEAAHLLMVRHYIEGLFFGLSGIYCFVQSLRKDRPALAMIGSFFYLFAILYKEIYLMFVFFILLLPEKSLRRRFLYAMPWLGITIAFSYWRYLMLGHVSGGYGFAPRWPHDISIFFPNMLSAMGGDLGDLSLWWQWGIGASALVVFSILLKTKKNAFFYLPAISACVLLPVFPVASMMSPRFVILPLFSLVAGHVFAWDSLMRSRHRLYTSVAVFLWFALMVSSFLFLSSSRPFLKEETIQRHAVEGKFVLYNGKASDLLVWPAAISQGHYYNGLSWLREHILGNDDSPGISGDPNVVCPGILPVPEGTNIPSRFQKVWHFDTSSGSLQSEDFTTFCGMMKRSASIVVAPLSLRLNYKDSVIRWELGPYQNGTFTMLFGETANDVIDLPPRGSRLIYLKNRTSVLRLLHTSPAGWLTYSPLLTFTVDATDSGSLEWKR